MKYVLIIIFVLFQFCGCSWTGLLSTKGRSVNVTMQEDDIQKDTISSNLPIIAPYKIMSSLIPSSIIGSHHTGLADISRINYTADGALSESAQENYKNILDEELLVSRYSKVKKSKIFDIDESSRAKYLLGGTITRYILNTFSSIGGERTDCSITIDWEIFDRETNAIICKSTHDGIASIGRITTEAGFVAFRNSVREFLGSKKLRASFTNIVQVPDTSINLGEILYYKENNRLKESANKIDAVIKAVFAVKTKIGHGSGFLINPQGYALTNYHVVRGISELDAIFDDGKSIKANVIRCIPEKDLALIKLTGGDYPYLAFLDENKLSLALEVFAIGTPVDIGLSHSVSKGIISGIRKLEQFTLVQTDAAMNPGNSGGPLVDVNGNVIGIVSMKLAEFGIEGLGFAISIQESVKAFKLINATK